MTPMWRVKRAMDPVNRLRRVLHAFGYVFDPMAPVQPAILAQAYLDCAVVPLAGLTDRMAMQYLMQDWRVNAVGEQFDETPQAGGLYVAESGAPRWIFVEPSDGEPRQRFTVAHEIGHLWLEAIPALERHAASVGSLVPTDNGVTLLRYGRCALTRTGALTAADKRELNAHDFAAELLMPLEGVRRIIREHYPTGFRSEQEVRELAKRLIDVYEVSGEAAARRTSDLELTTVASGQNGDLFA